MLTRPLFKSAVVLLTATCALHYGCNPAGSQEPGELANASTSAMANRPVTSERSEDELREVFQKVLARYQQTPAKAWATNATAKSLSRERTGKTLNIRMREPIAKIRTTAKMSGSANIGAPIRATGGTIKKEMTQANIVNVEFPAATDDRHLAAVMDFLRGDGRVDVVEPDYTVRANAIPNDPMFPQLWGLRNTASGTNGGVDIRVVDAWDRTTGFPPVVVGIIDTGIDCAHEDLSQNCWTNPGETGLDGQGRDKSTNGIDDDGNGYVDDWQGWNFVDNNNRAGDDNRHGTHVAGTIGASGNNSTGVTGVNWVVSLAPLKFLSSSGSGSISDAILALDYATRMGFFATNNSWGGGDYSTLMEAAIMRAHQAGSLFVAAAGNDQNDNDAKPSYPASYMIQNVIPVAAVDQNGNLASFSNYGAHTVGVAAPGVGIMSTLPGNKYGTLSGTSMAAPHVTGTLALMKAFGPTMRDTGVMLKSRLMNGVQQLPSLANRVVTGGIISVPGALNASVDRTPPSPPADIQVSRRGVDSALLSWLPAGDDGTSGTASNYRIRISENVVASQAEWDLATEWPVKFRFDNGRVFTDLTGLPIGFSGWVALRATDEVGNESGFHSPIELKLVPFRTLMTYDANAGGALPANTPWIIEEDSVRGKVFSDGAGPYATSTKRRMTMREIPLKGAQNLAISYWSRASIEPDYDFGYVTVSYPGQPEGEWRRVDSVTGFSGWEKRSVDLSYFVFLALSRGASSIQLHFDLVSDNSIEYEGWFVDDIDVRINDSLITLTGIPDRFSPPNPIDVTVSGPAGTLYTSAFRQGPEIARDNCSDDQAYAHPLPRAPLNNPLRISQDGSFHKFLCVRAQVPGYKDYVHAWGAWQNAGPEISVVASGQPSGESNIQTVRIVVSQGSKGLATSWNAAMAKPATGVDACADPALAWSTWQSIGTPASFNVHSFLGGQDGDVVLCVRGRDAEGNIQVDPLAIGWHADFHGPEIVIESGILPLSRETQVSARISGPADIAGCGVALVAGPAPCPQDPASYFASSSTSSLASSLACDLSPRVNTYPTTSDGPWKLCAIGRDRAGNPSPVPRSISWVRDTVPPVARLTGNPPVSKAVPQSNIEVTGSDIDRYRYATATSASECDPPLSYQTAGRPIPLAIVPGGDGNRILCVIARDAAGNESPDMVTMSWVQDTVARPLVFTGLPAAASNARTLSVGVTSGEGGTYRYIVQAGRTCNTANLLRAARRPVTDSIFYNLPLADGEYTLCATFTDTVGNEQETPTVYTWVKDTAPPVATFLATPGARTSDPVGNFRIGGTGVVEYQWALTTDSTSCANVTYGSFIPVATVSPVNAGQPGAKLLCVRGRDAAGNVQASPSTWRWTLVPPTPPVVSVISGAPFSPTGKSNWSIVVGGDRVTAWQFALLNSLDSNCANARYGSFNNLRTGNTINPVRFDDGNANGYRTLCIRGKDDFDQVQTTPTIVRWLKFAGAPLADTATTYGTVVRNASSGTTENLLLSRNNTGSGVEVTSIRMCPVAATTGLLGSCRSASVTMNVGESSKAFQITGVGAGNWVIIALPPAGRGRVEPLFARK